MDYTQKSRQLVFTLAAIAEKKGLSQATIAEKTGLQKPNISLLLTGKRDPTLTTLLKVADALGVTLKLHDSSTEATLNAALEAAQQRLQQ